MSANISASDTIASAIGFRIDFVFVDNLPQNVKPELSLETWNNIHDGLRSAIVSSNGTGKKSDTRFNDFLVYGKKGTEEKQHGENHAWFVGWADYNSEKYSIVILLENAGSGGAVAAPMAKKVFEKIIENSRFASR